MRFASFVAIGFALALVAPVSAQDRSTVQIPEELRFQAPPAGLPDAESWPEIGFRLAKLEVGTEARTEFVKLGACAADAPCFVLDGHFRHSNTDVQAGIPYEHIDRYIIIGSAGRLEGYSYQGEMEGPYRFFVFAGGAWQEVAPKTKEYQTQSELYAGLSQLLNRLR